MLLNFKYIKGDNMSNLPITVLSDGFRMVGTGSDAFYLDPRNNRKYTLEEYTALKEKNAKNALTWMPIDDKDAEDILSDDEALIVNVSDPAYPDSRSILIVDKEGVISLLRMRISFGGASEWTLASDIEMRYAYYLIDKFRDEILLEEFNRYLEAIYGLSDVPLIDEEPFYNENGDRFDKKELVINNKFYRFSYKNGFIYSLKVVNLISEADVLSAEGKGNDTARKLATGGFSNIK
jgi:hypothetical protein